MEGSNDMSQVHSQSTNTTNIGIISHIRWKWCCAKDFWSVVWPAKYKKIQH